MLPIHLDWIVSASAAAWLGFSRPRSTAFTAALGLLIAVVAWLATYPLVGIGTSFGGDISSAEDYINDVGYGSSMLADAVFPLAWTSLWLAIGWLAMRVGRRFNNSD